MDPVKVFFLWLYSSRACTIEFFLRLTSECLNKNIYQYINTALPEIAKLRKYNNGSRGLKSVFEDTDLGLSCSLQLAGFLLGWETKTPFMTDSVKCVKNFMENPNLGIYRMSTRPKNIVKYFLMYGTRFKTDPIFNKFFYKLDSDSRNRVWRYITTKCTLKYCLNNFPDYTKQIVAAVIEENINFEPSFLNVIDEYEENLYSPIQKKNGLDWVRRNRKRTRKNIQEEVKLDSKINIKVAVDNINDTTAFLLKKRKKYI